MGVCVSVFESATKEQCGVGHDRHNLPKVKIHSFDCAQNASDNEHEPNAQHTLVIAVAVFGLLAAKYP